MARRAIAVLAAMALACLHRPPSEPPREPAPAATPAAERPPPPEPSPPKPAAKPPPKKAEPPKAPAAKEPTAKAPRATLTAWKAEGCLTARSEEEAMRISRQPRAGGAGPPVSFERSRGGIVVVHRLAHACCLSANVHARVEDGRYVVVERLSGKACGCFCDSTLRTTLSAPVGEHPISVEVDVHGLWKHAYEGTFEVR